jgi:hypothetical protein
MGKKKAVCGGLVGKPEGKKPLAIHMNRRGDNIKTGLGEVKWGLGLD